MRAIVIAIGSEFLTQNRMETNTSYICNKLLDYGILTDTKIIVGDDRESLVWILKKAVKKAQWLIITGGLGPTEDDVTRESVAAALRRKLVYCEEIEQEIRERFYSFRSKMSDNNKRQAFIIDGAEVLKNSNGSAPGLYISNEPCNIVLLPGPPEEMKPMFDQVLKEKITPRSKFSIYQKSLKFSNISESELDFRIADFYRSSKVVTTTILSEPGMIEIKLMGRAKKEHVKMQEETDRIADKIICELRDFFITDKDLCFEEYIVQELIQKKLTLSVAESCTGGGLGRKITSVAGSSEIFAGGVIAYSNEIKEKLLGVKEHTLIKHGAVSKECAKELAVGIRKLCKTDLGVSVTGIAGPGGGTQGKPVGLVFMHLSAADEEMGIYQVFPGKREKVRERTINTLLGMINRYLTKKR